MDKYQSVASPIVQGVGVAGMIAGTTGICGDASTAMAISGGSALLAGYAMDVVSYMKGYFSERLDLEERKLKANELEKSV